MDENKKTYELAFLLSPELTEEDVAAKVKEIKELILTAEGEITNTLEPRRQRLAYPINKLSQGSLGTLIFALEPAKVKDIVNKVKQTPGVLRELLVVYEKPSDLAPPPRRRPIAPPPKPFTELRPEERVPMPSVEEIDKKLEEIIK